MTQGEFAVQIERLMNAFCVSLKPNQLDAYWATLKDLTCQSLEAAITNILSSDPIKLPTPIVIKNQAEQYMNASTAISEDMLEIRRRLIERKIKKLEALKIQTQRSLTQLETCRNLLLTQYRSPIDESLLCD